jgi:hypothetical protein
MDDKQETGMISQDIGENDGNSCRLEVERLYLHWNGPLAIFVEDTILTKQCK